MAYIPFETMFEKECVESIDTFGLDNQEITLEELSIFFDYTPTWEEVRENLQELMKEVEDPDSLWQAVYFRFGISKGIKLSEWV